GPRVLPPFPERTNAIPHTARYPPHPPHGDVGSSAVPAPPGCPFAVIRGGAAPPDPAARAGARAPFPGAPEGVVQRGRAGLPGGRGRRGRPGALSGGHRAVIGGHGAVMGRSWGGRTGRSAPGGGKRRP